MSVDESSLANATKSLWWGSFAWSKGSNSGEGTNGKICGGEVSRKDMQKYQVYSCEVIFSR